MSSAARVAVVTGASRGIGRGVAIALDQAGYRVFATGRSIASAKLPPAVVRIACDHRDDEATCRAFSTIASQAGSLDILANCAWGGYERMVEDGKFTWPAPFWEQSLHRWESMFDAGVRAAFVCSAQAAKLMIPQKRGLIVSLGFWSADKHIGNAIYGAAKAATNKLTSDMAHELKEHGISAVTLYPGLVRTEAVLEAARSGAFDLSNSESPEFIGRVIVALAADPKLKSRTGETIVAAALARELGVVDIDGKSPAPISLSSL